MKTKANKLISGTIYETTNGNRYLVIDDKFEAYIGNVNSKRNDTQSLIFRESEIEVNVIGKVVLT